MASDILPCPNPKCVCKLCRLRWEAWGIPPEKHWQVACEGCGYHGPWANSETDAVALHNAIPREEKWQNPVLKSERTPAHDWLEWWTAGGDYRGVTCWDVFDIARENSNTTTRPGRWRPHTPPKPPEES